MKTRARGVIITADDFGLHESINEAVELAHTEGVLTATSLMVSATASKDAIARARRLPELRVGLHLVLADGAATLPRSQIPDLVDATGRFGQAMVRDGIRFFFSPKIRRQLADEIRAQFEAFSASGLVLDHVNAHKHFHLHPTVLSMILEIGKDYGVTAMRLPRETGASFALRPWLLLMQRRLKRARIACNDHVFGIAESGRMDESALLDAIARAPAGITEIYLHPATRSECGIAKTMQNYRHAEELAALLSPRVRDALDGAGLVRGGFIDFFGCES